PARGSSNFARRDSAADAAGRDHHAARELLLNVDQAGMEEERGDDVAIRAAPAVAERRRGVDAPARFDHARAFAEERGCAFGRQARDADRVGSAVVETEAAGAEGRAHRLVTGASE